MLKISDMKPLIFSMRLIEIQNNKHLSLALRSSTHAKAFGHVALGEDI